MCGIAGYVGSGTESELGKMLDAVKHRGPDDTGTLLRGSVGMAHARLAVLDTSSAGHQPMELPDKSVAIVLNGEIYNFKELRESLLKRGCTFRSTSDTEVLLWLYKLDGDDFLKQCVGMFALALYDFTQGKLILARDRMGEKPLYWTRRGDALFFASELSAIMKSGVAEARVDTAALAHYLAFDFVPTPQCIIEGVHKLEPATMLIFERGTVVKEAFWQIPSDTQSAVLSEAISGLDSALSRSVAGQLVADVPLGVFLSGGLDSSSVAYYAQQASSRKIHTFSIGFDEPSFDESAYARTISKYLGTEHHEERLSGNDALALVPDIADVFSEPVADASVLPTMLLSRFARKSVTVALGGDGGDELFAGYPTFQADRAFALFRRFPRAARDIARGIASALPASHDNFSFAYNLKKLVSSDERNAARRHAEWLGTFTSARLDGLAGPDLAMHSESNLFEHVDRYAQELSGGNALLWAYARSYLLDQVLVKVDRASMHYALETRAPLLDHRLVEFAFSLPYGMKYRRGTTKYILKQLMHGKLPQSIIDRKKKGFGIPLARWLTKELRPLCDELLSPNSMSKHSLFSQAYVDRLKGEHMDGKCDNRKELWNLMVFQLWYDRWMR